MVRTQAQDLVALTIRAQKGDREALAMLIEASQDQLFKFCLYLCGHRPLAQDLCQDTLIKVLEGIKKLKKPESLGAWMRTTAKNLYLDHIKSSKNRNLPLDADFDPSDANAQADGLQDRLEFKKALNRLAPETRLVLLLVDLEGYSYLEAAQILEISESAMKSRVFRARQELVDIFDSQRNENPSSIVYSRGVLR